MNRIPDTHADLVNGVVALATVDARGYPQVTAVTVKHDADGRIHASVNTTRRKYRNMSKEPRVTLFAVDPNNAHRTLEVRADVELVPDPGKTWSREFAGPNVDIDQLDAPGTERVHVVLTPVSVNVLG